MNLTSNQGADVQNKVLDIKVKTHMTTLQNGCPYIVETDNIVLVSPKSFITRLHIFQKQEQKKSRFIYVWYVINESLSFPKPEIIR